MSNIIQNIARQRSVEGDTTNIRMLEVIVNHINSSITFHNLVHVRWQRHGPASHAAYPFYYVKPEVKMMARQIFTIIDEELMGGV